MLRQLFIRMLSAAGLFMLGFVLVGAAPFLASDVEPHSQAPAVSVDRTLKGDRLPVRDPLFVPDWQYEFTRWPSSEPRAQIPFACDAVISTIFVPAKASLYRRCMA